MKMQKILRLGQKTRKIAQNEKKVTLFKLFCKKDLHRIEKSLNFVFSSLTHG